MDLLHLYSISENLMQFLCLPREPSTISSKSKAQSRFHTADLQAH